jgi:hypothetical protein
MVAKKSNISKFPVVEAMKCKKINFEHPKTCALLTINSENMKTLYLFHLKNNWFKKVAIGKTGLSSNSGHRNTLPRKLWLVAGIMIRKICPSAIELNLHVR